MSRFIVSLVGETTIVLSGFLAACGSGSHATGSPSQADAGASGRRGLAPSVGVPSAASSASAAETETVEAVGSGSTRALTLPPRRSS